MEQIAKYFPDLPVSTLQQFAALQDLYLEWNSKINVISRKDMDNFYTHHVLHSLAIARLIQFRPGTSVMDVGTGGGFPGIPLAIMFPHCNFTLVDSIGKKVRVVQEVATALGLENVSPLNARAENIPGRFDFIVSRAVTALPAFMEWVKNKMEPGGNNSLPNGVIYLKGGDFEEELQSLSFKHRIYPIRAWFEDDFFDTKKIVHLYR